MNRLNICSLLWHRIFSWYHHFPRNIYILFWCRALSVGRGCIVRYRSSFLTGSYLIVKPTRLRILRSAVTTRFLSQNCRHIHKVPGQFLFIKTTNEIISFIKVYLYIIVQILYYICMHITLNSTQFNTYL